MADEDMLAMANGKDEWAPLAGPPLSMESPWVLASRLYQAEAERDAYREALAVIARDIADDGSVTQQQVDAAYALARDCAGLP